MDKDERSALIKSLSIAVREYVAQSMVEVRNFISGEVKALTELFEERIKSIPSGPKGEPGESIKGDKGDPGLSIVGPKGEPGTSGKDASPELVRECVFTELQKAIAELPKPKDGEPGKDADPEVIRALIDAQVAKAVAAIPPPKEGPQGIPGPAAEPVDTRIIVDEVLRQMPTPRDGKDADPIVIGEMVSAEVARAVSRIPSGKDGRDGKDAEPIHPDTIALMVVNEVTKAIAAMPKPKDGQNGEPGRDALQFDILPAIDVTKTYPRGTWAKHDGGLFRAFRDTTIADTIELSGWELILAGPSEPPVYIQSKDDPREFSVQSRISGGKSVVHTFRIPVPIYRRVYEPGQDYVKGDIVTCNNSAWHCEVDGTKNKPGMSEDWILMVRQGRPGKDADTRIPPQPQPVRLK